MLVGVGVRKRRGEEFRGEGRGGSRARVKKR
jgi:hypothetical protein